MTNQKALSVQYSTSLSRIRLLPWGQALGRKALNSDTYELKAHVEVNAMKKMRK